MKFVLEIECDNDAFADDPAWEIADILLSASKGMCRLDTDEPCRLRDSNGNTVGSMILMTEDGDDDE